MVIITFTKEHIPQALRLIHEGYERERRYIPILPEINAYPELTAFAENQLGVAAFQGKELLGFLCSRGPFNNAFRSTTVTGVFSPMHGNAATGENRKSIYAWMYQTAAEKWVRSGAVSHGICLYAHDTDIQEQLFRYGFGMRCIDAIRLMKEIATPHTVDVSCSELAPENVSSLFCLSTGLVQHFEQSPSFMRYPPSPPEHFAFLNQQETPRYFVAFQDSAPIAYLKLSEEGETFACSTKDMSNICGAFCLPEHRGKGVMPELLNFVIRKLASEGYTRLGVDFESFNPTAHGFWLKHFTAYTHSLVRRIDENILEVFL